ncbi:UTP--glucose-1-phosphate uridylyltransferase [Myxococcota bacterium]|nr:UTP--glucose-1-phosphate uridylyltransferase [Myxococcota bacterium]MBU1898320.1 UTP--glucose-1-phosphate uridylyltransferase [Myxococcota bacterium]
MSFAPFKAKMEAAALPAEAIAAFQRHYTQLKAGETGLIPEASISPVEGLADAEALPPRLEAVGRAALPHAVIIKLNGGLGTSMGLDAAKALLKVRGALSFLDLIARQARRLDCPLILMDSFATQADSLAALAPYGPLSGALPPSLLQHKVPKVDQATLGPVAGPGEALNWCPPGHGDLYTALVTRGALNALRADGRRYAFISNADNLGATLDLRVLGAFVESAAPLMMEVADRTTADRKGGHLAWRDARLILREAAQRAPEDAAAFQDVQRHRYFNTNNLWIDLEALAAYIAREGGVRLPMICNAKPRDPRDPRSTPVYQLESAVGAAIGLFEGAWALRVPRARFAPVKTCADLLAVRSDAYTLDEAGRLVLNPRRAALGPVRVQLDDRFYKHVEDLEARIPNPPSLLHCARLRLEGDVRLGQGVRCVGDVVLRAPEGAPLWVADGALLDGGGAGRGSAA